MDFGIVRVSSEEQAQTGLSIQTQIAELLKPSTKYPDKNIKEDNIFKAEGYSGGFKTDQTNITYSNEKFNITFNLKDRPDLKAFLAAAQTKDRLFITRFDRLSRDFSFLQQLVQWCKSKDIEICPLNDNSEEIVRQLLSVLGQWERSKTITRVQDSQKNMFEQGTFPYKPPKGYTKNTRNAQGRAKNPTFPIGALIPDKNAFIVQEAFRMALEGKSYKETCEALKIDPRTYYNIIHNRTYTGMIHYKGIWRKGNHPALISEETFQKINGTQL